MRVDVQPQQTGKQIVSKHSTHTYTHKKKRKKKESKRRKKQKKEDKVCHVALQDHLLLSAPLCAVTSFVSTVYMSTLGALYLVIGCQSKRGESQKAQKLTKCQTHEHTIIRLVS